eukprot:scaffold3195_cov100-Isochrysis_galbana.AAC.5
MPRLRGDAAAKRGCLGHMPGRSRAAFPIGRLNSRPQAHIRCPRIASAPEGYQSARRCGAGALACCLW